MTAGTGLGRRGRILTFIAWLLCMFSGSAMAEEGVLLAVKGKAAVLSHGASQPAKAGLRLRPGDEVRSLEGSVSGLLGDGRVFRVDQGEAYTVPADRASGPAGNLASRIMSTIRKTISRGRGPITKGVEREDREILLLYPHNAYVLPEDLRFEWERVAGVEQVGITIKCPSPIYRQTFFPESGETGAFLPLQAPPLIPGVRYYWKVQGVQTGGSEPHTSTLAWFAILETKGIREMRAAQAAIPEMALLGEEGRHVLEASLLISYGLYHKAAAMLREALEAAPEDRGIKELLGGLYLEMKWPEEAEKIL